MRMPAWYDIYGLSTDARQDEQGIVEASAQLDKIVEAELQKGIPANRIIIGGFSQGGSVAMYHAVTHDRPYAGVVGLSCWLPMHTKFLEGQTMVNIPKNTAIFQGHGTDDCVVPLLMGSATHDLFKRFQLVNCEFNTYPNLGHSSSYQEMQSVQAFLKKTLPPI